MQRSSKTIENEVRQILTQVEAETGIAFRLEADNLTPGGQIPGALEK